MSSEQMTCSDVINEVKFFFSNLWSYFPFDLMQFNAKEPSKITESTLGAGGNYTDYDLLKINNFSFV